jgi:hypothetical protein
MERENMSAAPSVGFSPTPKYDPRTTFTPSANSDSTPIDTHVPDRDTTSSTLPYAPPISQADMKRDRPKKEHHPLRTLAKAVAILTLATAGIAGTAATALVDPGALGPVGQPLNTAVVNMLPQGAQTAYHFGFDQNPNAEPSSAWGQISVVNPNNGKPTNTVLADANQANSVNVQKEAPGGQLKLIVQGIEGSDSSYTDAFTQLFDSKSGVYDFNQPMMMIHEGDRNQRVDDFTRIFKDYMDMKYTEAGHAPSLSSAFSTDPAVQSTYDVLKQALNDGDHIMVLAHSGGGAESVEALNLLASHGYKDAIHNQVKIIIMAGVASQQDAIDAGVAPNNVMYAGMTEDAVAQLGHVYISPSDPGPGFVDLVHSLSQASDWTLGTYHSPNETIVPYNWTHFQQFAQGVGGTYMATASPNGPPPHSA